MKKPIVRLSREARTRANNPDRLMKAAEAAIEAAGGGDIHFALVSVAGQQFALSSRLIIEVDWLPNRVPNRVIRMAGSDRRR